MFGWLREHIWGKVQAFEGNLLSSARKEILIKSVLQAIPNYVMSCFKLSDYLLHELESIISNYWWGDKEKNKVHLVKWQRLCQSKRDGGLGFRDLCSFNLTLLGKQLWCIIHYPNSLLSRILKAKYKVFP